MADVWRIEVLAGQQFINGRRTAVCIDRDEQVVTIEDMRPSRLATAAFEAGLLVSQSSARVRGATTFPVVGEIG